MDSNAAHARRTALVLCLALASTGSIAATAIPVNAQVAPAPGYRYGHRVLHGTVASFSPYRMLLAQTRDRTVAVDLHNGTVIAPQGTDLTPGMRVAVAGYWSKGTFIANRITLR